jgi:hypothetical protein
MSYLSICASLSTVFNESIISIGYTGCMKRVPVKSSNILSIGYDEENQLLEIEFNTHRVYRYSSVPPHVYAGLMQSESHGKYFLTYINSAYAYIEVA